MEELIEQIAASAADLEVARTANNRSQHRQRRVWNRTFDSVYASLITFQELEGARRVRRRTPDLAD